jgi:hypothetical protein
MSLSGLSSTGVNVALAAIMVSGTDRYVGLLTTLPNSRDGTGLVEASGSGYARVAHSAWLNGTSGSDVVRMNSGSVTFAALTAALDGIVGWGIWDAAAAGNLLAFGPMLTAGGDETSIDFIASDQPQFADQELKLAVRA